MEGRGNLIVENLANVIMLVPCETLLPVTLGTDRRQQMERKLCVGKLDWGYSSMILIYAYINKFKKYEQHICFDSSYHVAFSRDSFPLLFVERVRQRRFWTVKKSRITFIWLWGKPVREIRIFFKLLAPYMMSVCIGNGTVKKIRIFCFISWMKVHGK